MHTGTLNQISGRSSRNFRNDGASDARVSFPSSGERRRSTGCSGMDPSQSARADACEVMGVNGNFALHPVPPERQFTSSVNLRNSTAWKSSYHGSAPQWPEQHFGAIDKAKADAGREPYERTCKKCHFVRDSSGSFPMTALNKFSKQFVRMVMVSASEIGTDLTMAKNFGRLVHPEVLRPLLPQERRDAPKCRLRCCWAWWIAR